MTNHFRITACRSSIELELRAYQGNRSLWCFWRQAWKTTVSWRDLVPNAVSRWHPFSMILGVFWGRKKNIHGRLFPVVRDQICFFYRFLNLVLWCVLRWDGQYRWVLSPIIPVACECLWVRGARSSTRLLGGSSLSRYLHTWKTARSVVIVHVLCLFLQGIRYDSCVDNEMKSVCNLFEFFFFFTGMLSASPLAFYGHWFGQMLCRILICVWQHTCHLT